MVGSQIDDQGFRAGLPISLSPPRQKAATSIGNVVANRIAGGNSAKKTKVTLATRADADGPGRLIWARPAKAADEANLVQRTAATALSTRRSTIYAAMVPLERRLEARARENDQVS